MKNARLVYKIWTQRKGQTMSRRKFTAEQIINHLRTIEVLISQGKTAATACREVQITEQTYYRWRKEYGGMQTSQAKKLKDLKKG